MLLEHIVPVLGVSDEGEPLEEHLPLAHEFVALLCGAESGEHAALEEEMHGWQVPEATDLHLDQGVEALQELADLVGSGAAWEPFDVGCAEATLLGFGDIDRQEGCWRRLLIELNRIIFLSSSNHLPVGIFWADILAACLERIRVLEGSWEYFRGMFKNRSSTGALKMSLKSYTGRKYCH